jgi:hypothetical protein
MRLYFAVINTIKAGVVRADFHSAVTAYEGRSAKYKAAGSPAAFRVLFG